MLAVLPTLIAVLAGLALGISGGGRLENLWAWRPIAWKLAIGAFALQLLFKALPLSGGVAVVIDIASMAALLAFAVLNIRVGGMVLVVAGLSLNLVPTLMDWGTPVRPGSLVSAGLVTRAQLDGLELEGPRHLQQSGDSVAWLGEVIPLPTHQVIALGDLVLLLGEALVVSSLVRNRRVEGSGPRRARTRRSPSRRTPSGRAPRRRPPPRRTPPRRRAPSLRVEQEIDLRDPVRRRP